MTKTKQSFYFLIALSLIALGAYSTPYLNLGGKAHATSVTQSAGTIAATRDNFLGCNNNNWAGTGNSNTQNDTYDSVTHSTYDTNDIAYRLDHTNFGFDIPAGSTIDGITVEIDRYKSTGGAEDFRVHLMIAGSPDITENKADLDLWASSDTDTYTVYGSASDTWGVSPSESDVENSGFGVTLCVRAKSNNTDIHVDHVRMTIDYTVSPRSVSGTLYTDDGQTEDTSGGKTIQLRVATSTPGVFSTTTDSGSGAWKIEGIDSKEMQSGVSIFVYVDGSSTFASTFTKASSTASLYNTEGVDLYQNRVIVKHEATSGTSTTIADLSFYDSDDDSDIQFTANGGALSVATNTELHIAAGTTFAPGGNVTIYGNAGSSPDGDLHIDDGASFIAGESTTLAGSLSRDAGAVFTANAAGSITFNATTTGKTITGAFTGDNALGTTTFSGSGGGWTFNDSASVNNLTIGSGGTLVAPSTILTVNGNYTNNGTFTNNSGTVIFTAEENSSISGTITGSSGAFNDVIMRGEPIFGEGGFFNTGPDAAEGEAYAIAVAGSAIFIVGTEESGSNCGDVCWRYEKRDIDSGELLISTTSDPGAGDQPLDMTIDETYIYTIGFESGSSVCTGADDCWRIEKRNRSDLNLVTDFDTDGVLNVNPGGNDEWGRAIFVDDNYMYITGHDWTGNCPVASACWRTEKRNKTTGALCDGVGNCAVGAFDTDGVVIDDWGTLHDESYDVIADGSYVYEVGYQRGNVAEAECPVSNNYCFRISKRDIVTGAYDTGFGNDSGGQVWGSHELEKILYNVVDDASYLYVAGKTEGNDCTKGGICWRIEKRQKSDGASVSAFDDDGVIIVDPTSGNDYPYGLLVDGDYLYISGRQSADCGTGGTCQRIEKRDKTTGDLVDNFAGDGVYLTDSDNSAGSYINRMFIDGDYIYTAGLESAGDNCSIACWRIDKIDKVTGKLFNDSTVTFTFGGNASTSDLYIDRGTVSAPSLLSIGGDYTNTGTFTHNSGTVYFSSASAQTLSGTGMMTGTSAFAKTIFLGAGAKTFTVSASTTNFTIESGSGAVIAPPKQLTISGEYDNSNGGAFTHNSGTLFFDTGSSIVSGSAMTGSNAFNHVEFLTAHTIPGNASTTDLTIASGVTLTAPSVLTVIGNYTNNGTFTAGSGIIYLAGDDNTVAGAMTGASKFNDVVVEGISFAFDADGIVEADPSEGTDVFNAVYDDTNFVYVAGQQGGGCTISPSCWQIVKYNKQDGSVEYTIESDPTEGNEAPFAITGDDTYIYVAGFEISDGESWRVEKRLKSDGSLVTAFDTDGIATSSQSTGGIERINGIAVDDTSIYAIGFQIGGTGCDTGPACWRYEKRNKTTGALDTSFSGTGATTSADIASSNNIAYAVKVDDTYLYGIGSQSIGGDCGNGNRCWRIEKRLKSDGSFVTAFDTDGVVHSDPTAGYDSARAFDIDENYMYVAGIQSTGGDCTTGGRCFRIEKYDITTGALVNGFGVNGATTSDPTTADDTVRGLTVDSSYLYVFGDQGNTGDCALGGTCFRVEKRDITDATLVSSFGADGVYFSDPSSDNNFAWGMDSDNDYLYLAGDGCSSGDVCGYLEKVNKSDGTLVASDGGSGPALITFSANASMNNLNITTSSGKIVAPSGTLSIAGDYTNNGTFDANNGTTTFNGTSAQTATGNMTGASAFYNIEVTNASATTTFSAAASTANNFWVNTSDVRIEFTANATSTLTNLIISGSSGNEIYLHSDTPGTQWNINATTASVNFANIKDSGACTGAGDLTATNSINGGNNNCWLF